MTKAYGKEQKVRELTCLYIGGESNLSELYKALRELASPLYFKYVKNDPQLDFADDIMHDACVVCVENVKKGKIQGEWAWSKYLIRVLKNRAFPTNPLHLYHAPWKRKRAAVMIKHKKFKGTPIPTDTYDVGLEALCDSMENVGVLEAVDGEEQIREELSTLLKGYFKECASFLPFKGKGVQNLFLYFSVMSLFEISMKDKVFLGCKSGWLPKRYIFLAGLFRTRFKSLMRQAC